MKVVSVVRALVEIEFQRKLYQSYIDKEMNAQDVANLFNDCIDKIKHGIEEHLEHFNLYDHLYD